MYIFVSSIGRSGTKFLSEVFKKMTDLPSYHSIEPHCTGKCLVKKNNGKEEIDEFKKKINKIKKHAKEGVGLFESSHIFLRGYSDLAVKSLKVVYVIHMTRDPLEAARSYVNRDSVPGMKKRPWRLPLGTQQSLLKEIPNKELSRFQKNLVDWLENEMKYYQLKDTFTKTYDFYHHELNSAEAYDKMFQHFGLKVEREKIEQVLGQEKLAKNKNQKKTKVNAKDLKESDELIEKLKKYGVKIEIFRDPYYHRYEFIQRLIQAYDRE